MSNPRAIRAILVSAMQGPLSFSAQCPTCKNEISQGPRDPDEMGRLLKEDSLSFYCELCDLEWGPNQQELTNLDSKVRAILFRDLAEATAGTESAREAFTAITDDIPSGLPHSDGIQRIHNASRALSAARVEMLKAHSRLNDFLNRGVVPEDLKRSG